MSALTKWIIGAAIEVHRVPGPGLLESSDEEALSVEFELREIPFDRQADVDGLYQGRTLKGRPLEKIVDHQVGLEIKARAGMCAGRGSSAGSFLPAGNRLAARLMDKPRHGQAW